MTINDWGYRAWIESEPLKHFGATFLSAHLRDREADRFRSMFLGDWAMNDAVHKREDVERMLDRGEISESRARELLEMRWTVNSRGEKVIEQRKSQ